MSFRPKLTLLLAATLRASSACGSDAEPGAGDQERSKPSETTTPSEVRLKVLPHDASADDGPLSVLKSAEITKCWETGPDLNVQVFIEVPVQSVRVVVDFSKEGKFLESKSADMDSSAATFTLADAAGNFDACQLSAAVEAE